jgi:hypothetical protein
MCGAQGSKWNGVATLFFGNDYGFINGALGVSCHCDSKGSTDKKTAQKVYHKNKNKDKL